MCFCSGLLLLPLAVRAARKSGASDHAVRECSATTAKPTGTPIRRVTLPALNANPMRRPQIQSALEGCPLHFSLRRLPRFLAFPRQVNIP